MATPQDFEAELRTAWESGDMDDVATRAIERYGPEILGVLAARMKSKSDAAEVFSMFSEDLWRGLEGFQWRCSLRAWAHRIARNAATRYGTAGWRRPNRNVPMSQISGVVDRVRTETLPYLRTEVKSEMRKLRERLPDEEQLVLILRIDKKLDWLDVAAAMLDEDRDDAGLKREAARLRKRFQLAKGKLRDMAIAEGLLEA